jgi:hypothetical protein
VLRLKTLTLPLEKVLVTPIAVTAEPSAEMAVTLLPEADTVVTLVERRMSPLKPYVATPSAVAHKSFTIRANTVLFTADSVVVAFLEKITSPPYELLVTPSAVA